MKKRKLIILLFLLTFFTVTGTDWMIQISKKNTNLKESRINENHHYLQNVEKDMSYFPIPESTVDKSLTTYFENSWMEERNYGGKRGHEGTDIMVSVNKRGLFPVVSMTDGTVSKLGWLEKGGYRVGITSDSGIYYYYAHLDSFAQISEGDEIKAGDLLGFVGDSGYGPEGTTGKFPVHLHIGIYIYELDEEISINPYYVLKELENKKLKYTYF